MGYSRYVGRVGALAVMLGVGTAMATPAWADDGRSTSGSPSSGGSSAAARQTPKADSKRRTPASGVGTSNRAPRKPAVPQSISAPRAATLESVSTLPASNPGTPAVSAALLVMTAASRRQADDSAPAAAAPAATTTITINTWSQLISEVAARGGYISSPTAGTYQNNIPATLADTSWTLKNTDLDAFDATQTTFTYSTPYAQNAFVQSQLKNAALGLHLTYSASNYTAYLVATSPTNPSVISGGKQLTLGDTIVHPAPIIAVAVDANGAPSIVMPATTDPSWQSSYSVVILPKTIVPAFPGGDVTAPKAPTITTTKLTPESVTLKTSGSTDDVGVVGYNFYRASSYDYGQGNVQTTIWKANGSTVATGTTFVDTTVEPDTTYIYTARAVDAAGHESLDSAPLLVKTPAPDTESPTAPTITATNVTTTTATLNVFGSTDNVGVDGYDIYRDGLQVNIAPVRTGQSFVDTDLTPGTQYSYTAQAFDAAGNYSDESAPVVVTTTGSTGGGGNGGGDNGGGQATPLPVPKLKASSITDGSVKLTVSAGAQDSRVVSYWIYRDGQLIAQLDSNGASYTDDNLDSDVTYRYTAKAIDAAFSGSELSRSLPVTTYSTEEWAYRHGSKDSFWEKTWEDFNEKFGWIPLVGDVLSAISTGIDIAELGRAIASRDKHQIFDELKDLGGDLIGFIPFAKAVDEPLAAALEALAKQPVRKTTESVAFWLAGRIYDATVPPR